MFRASFMPSASVSVVLAAAMRSFSRCTSLSTAVSRSFCVDSLRGATRGSRADAQRPAGWGGDAYPINGGAHLLADTCAARSARRIAARSVSDRTHSSLRAVKRFCRSA